MNQNFSKIKLVGINMKTIEKKRFLKVIPENIPKELRDRPQWVCWRAEERGGKVTKVPYNPWTGDKAQTNNPKTWSDFERAKYVYEATGMLDGVGFVFTADDPFVGWDFDDCRNPQDGEIDPQIRDAISKLNSYTEVSPSGTGIRIIVEGTLPPHGRKKGDSEVYEKGRYLTFTGHHLDNTPLSIEHRQAETDALHAKIFTRKGKKPTPKPLPTNLQEVLKRAFRSKNGREIEKLYSGDFSGYKSQSEADLALCSHLAFWFNEDMKIIDQVFRSSGLYRKKWDEKRGLLTYGETTVELACVSCTGTYQEYQSANTNNIGNRQKTSPILTGGKGITARDLMKMQFPEPKWAIPDILPEGLNILAGKPKRGKSFLVLNAGVAIASGGKAFGKIEVEKGTVLYFALEDTDRRLQKRLSTMLQGKQGPPKLRLYTQSECPRMGQGGLRFLEQEIKNHDEVRLVIIDTFARFRPAEKGKSGNPYDIDYDNVARIKDLADKYSISILIVHHQRKGDDVDIIESVSGTLGITGAADGILVLLKKTGQADAELKITGRDVEEAEYALRFERSLLAWQLLGQSQEVQSTQKRQLVYDAIKNSTEPISPKELSEITELEAKYVQKSLPSLIEDGSIKRIDRGKYIYCNTIEEKSEEENPLCRPRVDAVDPMEPMENTVEPMENTVARRKRKRRTPGSAGDTVKYTVGGGNSDTMSEKNTKRRRKRR